MRQLTDEEIAEAVHQWFTRGYGRLMQASLRTGIYYDPPELREHTRRLCYIYHRRRVDAMRRDVEAWTNNTWRTP